MNLKRLDYFCQLAQLGNFTRTARKIGIAQPALTIAMQKLEQEVGLKLINRAEKNALLTADGKVFYQYASALLEQSQQMSLALEELKGGMKGEVSLGVSAMMGSYFFPELLTKFKKKYPDIKIRLIDQGTDALETMLINGELDLALVRCDHENDQLRYTARMEEEVVAAMAITHELALNTHTNLAEFCRYPLVLFHEGYFLRESVSHFSKQNQIKLDIRMETNLIELQKSLVKNDVGITTCLARTLVGEHEIKAIPFIPKMSFKLGLAWKKSHYLSKASQVFIQFFEDTIRDGE
ncbi:LysR family transcriptional regulator [Marinomonas sp. SBI22]|uniref:LysR family transcriptional regulator n=1 Tax=unclassified Marinomonas TaxID=196814 RepID=UPI0007AFD58A|nr:MULTISPECIES: LysR family transcriptional regulator [unclassified Marinomonas]KZM42451.1 LysR family transcriptional regulator [Marinomonas sp. SBI22]KZM43845.1 LysR family transcriptional regulator [Marinomonas sp. SBI8L]